jgi:hypothetical protein
MTGKPYQSVLIPYEEEIHALRHRRPPCSYARIAQILQEKYQLSFCRETIFKFVKVRTRGRKVYAIYRAPLPKKPKTALAKSPQANQSPSPPKPKWDFQFSERYNLHRLPPEEAAAIRKKLEAEGH